MVVKKELGCCKALTISTRIEHIKEAQRYCDEVVKIIGPNDIDTGALVQVTLEQYILMGKKVCLDSRETGLTKDRVAKKKKVVAGIDGALKEMEKKYPNKYDENVEYALSWRKRFTDET